MANKPLLYTIGALITVGAIGNYIALAKLFPDDPLVAGSALTNVAQPQIEPTASTPPPAAPKQPVSLQVTETNLLGVWTKAPKGSCTGETLWLQRGEDGSLIATRDADAYTTGSWHLGEAIELRTEGAEMETIPAIILELSEGSQEIAIVELHKNRFISTWAYRGVDPWRTTWRRLRNECGVEGDAKTSSGEEGGEL